MVDYTLQMRASKNAPALAFGVTPHVESFTIASLAATTDLLASDTIGVIKLPAGRRIVGGKLVVSGDISTATATTTLRAQRITSTGGTQLLTPTAGTALSATQAGALDFSGSNIPSDADTADCTVQLLVAAGALSKTATGTVKVYLELTGALS